MNNLDTTSTRRQALKYAGLTGVSGLAGVTGLSVYSQPALALSGTVGLPSGLEEGSVDVPSYELQFANLDTNSDIQINYIFRDSDSGTTTTETHSVSLSQSTGSKQTGDHSISVPAGDIHLTIQLEHPSVGTVETQESTATTVASVSSIVDDFEDETFSEYDTSSGGNFAITSNQVQNGGFSLEADYKYDSASQKNIFSVSGLDTYPQKGDTFSFWYRANSGYGEKTRVAFNYIDADNNYFVDINQSKGGPNYYKIRIFRRNGGDATTICSTGGNGSWDGDANTWYEFEVVWKTSDAFELYVKDINGNVEASASGSDGNPLSAADGIMFNASGDSAYGSSTTKVWFDNFQIKNLS